MNEIKIFNYNNNQVRTVMKDGEPWFVLKDVCEVLSIGNAADVYARLDADEKGIGQIDTLGGAQKMSIINEPGLYNVILRSDKPQAKPFRKWVTAEVLPSIRKHGAYMTADTIQRAISDPDFLISLATTLKEEKEKNKVLTAENTGLKREVEHKENVIVGLVDDIDLATKRQRINQIVRHGVKNPALYKDRWALLYSEFEKKYHVNLSLRLENHANEYTPKLKNNMDVIDRQMGMVPNLYEIACKVFENDYDALMKEWENIIVM